MVHASAMAVIHCIDKLLKILSCFIFFQPPFTCLTQEKYHKNQRRYRVVIMMHNNLHYHCRLIHLTILSKSSPPVTNSKTMYIFVLLAITYNRKTAGSQYRIIKVAKEQKMLILGNWNEENPGLKNRWCRYTTDAKLYAKMHKTNQITSYATKLK